MSAAFRSRYWSHWIKPVTMNCFEYLEALTRVLAPTITRGMSLFVLGGGIQGGVGEEKAVATARDFTHVPGATRHGFKVAVDAGELFALTSRGNASAMFRAFDKGINRVDSDRSALVARAATYGQTIDPNWLGEPDMTSTLRGKGTIFPSR